jgi:hypothetical protein
MDIKSMLMDMAEAQADKMRDEAVGFLGSEEFETQVATKINEKIDIPFVSEEKEQIFFEKVVDVVTDLIQGVFRGK